MKSYRIWSIPFLTLSLHFSTSSLFSVVKDPVTGGDVIITDSSDSTKIDPDKLDSRFPNGYSTDPPGKIQDQKHPAPHPAQPSSILLQQFPPPIDSQALKKLNSHFDQLAIALAAAMAVTWFFVAFGSGWLRFFLRSVILGTVAFCGWCALHLSKRKIELDFEAGEWSRSESKELLT